jgi:hypothetical protein
VAKAVTILDAWLKAYWDLQSPINVGDKKYEYEMKKPDI